ncbi:hypothetical protein ZTR_07731 [Talaromyces verruculosus]|nr:hypothetical protein ZTR_07731 [Talaromyces verruculosus]
MIPCTNDIQSIKTVAQNPGPEDYDGQQRAQEAQAKLARFLTVLEQVDQDKIRSELHLLQPVPSPCPEFPAKKLMYVPSHSQASMCLILRLFPIISRDNAMLQHQLNDAWDDVKNLMGITVEDQETGAAATLSF